MRFWHSPYRSGEPGRNAQTRRVFAAGIEKALRKIKIMISSIDVQQNLHARIKIIPSRGS